MIGGALVAQNAHSRAIVCGVTQPFIQLRPASPPGHVLDRDRHGPRLSDQDHQLLAAGHPGIDQVLDIGPQQVGRAAPDEVSALAHKLHDQVAGIVDVIGVIPRAPDQRVDARPTVQKIGRGGAAQGAVPGVEAPSG